MIIKIGIDNGNKNTKTSHFCFASGISITSEKPALSDDWLQLEGDKNWYIVTNKRMNYMRDKSTDNRFFVLTLCAIAKEIKARKLVADKYEVMLGVGLPPEHLSSLKQKFASYFLQKDYVNYTYQGEKYSVKIVDVKVLPQGYSAVVRKIIEEQIGKYPVVYIVDIGGYTVDIIEINHGKINILTCQSKENGVIQMYNNIIKTMRTEDIIISEEEIDAIVKNDFVGIYLSCDDIAKIKELAQEHFDKLLAELREEGYDLKSRFTFFIGGGSCLFSDYINESGKIGQKAIIQDVCANAKGYEYLLNNL